VLSLHLLFRLGAYGIVAGLVIAVGVMILRGDIRRAIPFVILSWGISEGYASRLMVAYYTDPNGIRNSFGVSSLLLAIVFIALLAKEGAFVARFLRTPMFVAFYVLFACAVLSQVWYLGFVPGVGLAYDRVLQPMMVVALMGYLGRSQSGLRRAFLWIIGAVALAISLRYAAGVALGPDSVSSVVDAAGGVRRVGALGSWTIYGTICASILPLIVSLVAVDRRRSERVALVLVGLVTVKEVLATGTRGAILGFVALLVFLLRRRARWWMVALVAAVLVGAVAFGFRAGFSESRALSFDVGTMLSEPNTRGRFERNLAAIHYIAERPLSGSGLGLPLRVDGTDIGTWVYNPYLAWGVAMGLIALLAFAAIVGMSVVYSIGNWRASSGNFRTLQVGLTASLLVWLLNQFTTGDSLTYLQSAQASFFFYAILGLILGSRLGRQRHLSIAPTESG
jgi:O-antigen ligase